jgi:hypothetical protein
LALLYLRAMNSENRPSTLPNKSGPNPVATTVPDFRASVALLGAGLLLLLLGLALLAEECTYGNFLRQDSWILTVTLPGLWNMLTGLWVRLVPPEAARLWPLLLVMAGGGLITLSRRKKGVPAKRDSMREEGRRE